MSLRASVLTLALAWMFTLQSLNVALSQQGPNPPTTPSGNVPPQPAAPTQPEPAPLPGEAIDQISKAQEELKAAQDAHEKALVEWEASTGDEGRRRTLQGARQKLKQAESMLQSARDARILSLDAGLERLNSMLKSRIEVSDFDTGNLGAGAAAAVDTAVIPGRRVHLLIYATGDDGSRNGIVQGARANAVFVDALFRKMCAGTGRLITNTTKYQFSGKTIADDLARINPAKEDAMVVYIATHGAFNLQDGTHFLTGTKGNPPFNRADIYQRLKARGASLNLLITDACGTLSAQGPPKGQLETPPSEKWPLWHLVFKTRGDVNVNAATFGEVALYRFYDRPVEPQMMGGVFTRAFVNRAVYGDVPELNEQAWTRFFRGVSQLAVQHPLLEVENRLKPQPRACFLDASGRKLLDL